ncbi:MAG: ATP phosphoribosyltransferase [Armatimonadota bacterium]|nr:ATP phosphoribosyltransferase [Armatimonadota bacterium]MDW8155353.1 ATP phosphoribosyltransferase [Armatimonadota bacterium]
MKPLVVALPSGRLLRDAIRLLRAAGYRGTDGEDRSLVWQWGELTVIVAKPVDLLTYVERGAADCGVVGKDVLLEQAHEVYELVDLGFGRCRGVVALPAIRRHLWEDPRQHLRVATKYPRVAERFFWERGRPVEIVQLYGSVELAPRVGLSDGILDLVMTGATLRANGLVEVAEVFQSTARLVVNPVSLRTRSEAVQELVARLTQAVQEVP